MSAPHCPEGAVGAQRIIRKNLRQDTTSPASVLQGLRCTACGSEGRIPTIAIPPDDPQPALRLTFLSDGPGLLCAPRCRDGQA
jgi:hypothetical protein